MTDISFEFDLFVSHASEDKERIARPLVNALERLGLRVWFDEAVLRLGDSLSSSIDKGLSTAKYGVVILSPQFFAKNWPKYELSGLKARQLNGQQVILPIWHNVARDDVLSFSPPLADMVAYNTNQLSVEEIAEGILQVVNPDQHSRWFIQTARKAMLNLDKTEFHGTAYDYWPEGGIRNLYEHLLTFGAYVQLSKSFGRKVFLSGPHTDTTLNLNDQYSFGHYNPEFVQWLHSNINFILANPTFIRTTQKLFEKYLYQLTHLYYAAYQYLHFNPKTRIRLQSHYMEVLDSRTIRPQYYWNISFVSFAKDKTDPIVKIVKELDKIADVNRASSSIYFWIRRYIDETANEFFSLLVDTFKAYDSAMYSNINTFTKWIIED